MLVQICTELEVPLIFDEIAAAFRIAPGGAQELYGVEPDLCCLGKVIAGGFPMAAVGGKAEFMEVFDTSKTQLPQIGTFNGHPVAAAAGIAAMAELTAEGGFDSAMRHGEKLMAGIAKILDDAGLPHQVIGPPTLFDFFLIESEVVDYRGEFLSNRDLKAAIIEAMKGHGVYKAGIKFYPSTAHTDEDAAWTLRAFEAAVAEATGQ